MVEYFLELLESLLGVVTFANFSTTPTAFSTIVIRWSNNFLKNEVRTRKALLSDYECAGGQSTG